MNSTALELHDLTVSYAKKPVLYVVDFQLPQGALVCIIVPNGSGKSTMIRAIIIVAPVIGSCVNVMPTHADFIAGHCKAAVLPQDLRRH